MADMLVLEIPTEMLDDVQKLIDYMGWQDGEVDDVMLEHAQRVWVECGPEPDYAVQSVMVDPSLDFDFVLEFYPSDDARVMISVLREYIEATRTSGHALDEECTCCA